MANFTPIALLNGAATPVSITYSPVSRDGGVPLWRNLNTDIVSGSRNLTTGNQDTKERVKRFFRFELPVAKLNVDTSVYSIVDVDYVNLSFNFGKDSDLARRKDALAFAKNLLAHTIATELVVDQLGVW